MKKWDSEELSNLLTLSWEIKNRTRVWTEIALASQSGCLWVPCFVLFFIPLAFTSEKSSMLRLGRGQRDPRILPCGIPRWPKAKCPQADLLQGKASRLEGTSPDHYGSGYIIIFLQPCCSHLIMGSSTCLQEQLLFSLCCSQMDFPKMQPRPSHSPV